MSVRRVNEFKITVSGPGEGQRDAWSGEWDAKFERNGQQVVFTASPGTSGRVFRFDFSDLCELVNQVDT